MMSIYRFLSVSLAALPALFLLSGCDAASQPEWLNNLQGRTVRPYPNTADGHRRAPALNPRPGSLKGPAKGPGGGPSRMETNPYDYFDDVGNPLSAPPQPMPPPPTPYMENHPASPGAVKTGGVSPRKFFPVNLPYSETMEASMPAPAAAAMDAAEPAPMPAAHISIDTQPMGKPAPYPTLSSVPYIPAEMREIRAQKDREMRTLEEDRRQAHYRKENLLKDDVPPPEGAPLPWQPGTAPMPDNAAAEPAGPERYADRVREWHETVIKTPAQY